MKFWKCSSKKERQAAALGEIVFLYADLRNLESIIAYCLTIIIYQFTFLQVNILVNVIELTYIRFAIGQFLQFILI